MIELTSNTFAASGSTTGPSALPTPTAATVGVTTLSGLVGIVVIWLTYIAGAAAFIYLVYSGILYISAAGNPDQAKKGQQGIINAVIGIIVVVLAYTIIQVAINGATGGT